MKVAKYFKLVWTGIIFCLLLVPRFNVWSATATGPSNISVFQNPLKDNTIQEFLVRFLEIVIQIAFPFIVLAVMYTGFLFVKAQGNPEELKTAKQAFLWTVVGALLILGALAVSELIKATVGEVIR